MHSINIAVYLHSLVEITVNCQQMNFMNFINQKKQSFTTIWAVLAASRWYRSNLLKLLVSWSNSAFDCLVKLKENSRIDFFPRYFYPLRRLRPDWTRHCRAINFAAPLREDDFLRLQSIDVRRNLSFLRYWKNSGHFYESVMPKVHRALGRRELVTRNSTPLCTRRLYEA